MPLPPLAGLRVLVVDHDHVIVDLLAGFLRDQGADVAAARDAAGALALVDSHRPAILLCELRLPSPDGYWLIREVRRRPTEHAQPIKAISMNVWLADPDASRSAGFDLHLTKPFTTADLLDAVCRVRDPGIPAGQ